MPKTSPFVGLRCARGLRVDTAVRAFRHGDGRNVTVVGTVHHGPREYFEELREIVAAGEDQGAAVHFESLSGATGEWSTQPERQVALFRAVGVDFISQQQGLPAQRSWTNVDWSVDAVDFLGALQLDRNLDSTVRAAETLTPRQRRGEKQRLRIGLFRSAVTAIDSGRSTSLVDDARTVHAAYAAIRAQGDVVMIWGASHIAGIGTLLNRVGFELTDTQWFTALPRHLPPWTPEQDSSTDPRERDTVTS